MTVTRKASQPGVSGQQGRRDYLGRPCGTVVSFGKSRRERLDTGHRGGCHPRSQRRFRDSADDLFCCFLTSPRSPEITDAEVFSSSLTRRRKATP